MPEGTERQRIAVIGSGIAGLTAAHLLSRQHEVTVFEANDYIGGHTHTVPVEMQGRRYDVDTGFIVCNDRNYPHFLQLLSQLDVALQPTEMSFSVTNRARNLEYNGHRLQTLFAQRRNLLRPGFYGLIADILRFNRAATRWLAQSPDNESTLDDFIAAQGLGRLFRDNYLLPMVAAIWSCSVRQAGEFPLAFLLGFFHNHGLLSIRNRPQWYVIEGGSHRYIAPVIAPFRQRLRLNCAVRQVQRVEHPAGAVAVQTAAGTEHFEQVVFACHSDQALALLAESGPAEREILGALGYQANEVILHNDRRLLPQRQRAWASWNFLAGEAEAGALPCVTYCMNILQGLKSPEPLLVTLNPDGRIAPNKVIERFEYAHPVFNPAAASAQQRRSEICGVGNVHFCGAYWYNGFHEDGVRSALDVCARFGVTL